jgi:hypothetical protein
MFEIIGGLPDGVVGVRAVGKVTGDDYEKVLDPAVEAALKATGSIRILFVLGPEFTEYTPDAMLHDTEEYARTWRHCERMAVVTDVGWVRNAVDLFRHAMPDSMKLYAMAQLDDATAWVAGA